MVRSIRVIREDLRLMGKIKKNLSRESIPWCHPAVGIVPPKFVHYRREAYEGRRSDKSSLFRLLTLLFHVHLTQVCRENFQSLNGITIYSR